MQDFSSTRILLRFFLQLKVIPVKSTQYHLVLYWTPRRRQVCKETVELEYRTNRRTVEIEYRNNLFKQLRAK